MKRDFGSQLVIKTKVDKDFNPIGYALTVKCDVPESWLNALKHFTRPARGDVVAMEVTRLRSVTAKRKESDLNHELTIAAITEELAVYPEDIVRTVCRERGRKSQFFPTLKELIDQCEELFLFRKAALDGLTSPTVALPKPSEEWTPPSEDQKKAVSDLVAEFLKGKTFDGLP